MQVEPGLKRAVSAPGVLTRGPGPHGYGFVYVTTMYWRKRRRALRACQGRAYRVWHEVCRRARSACPIESRACYTSGCEATAVPSPPPSSLSSARFVLYFSASFASRSLLLPAK